MAGAVVVAEPVAIGLLILGLVVGLLGVLQPFADGLKLLIKETILPSRANQIIFLIAPILTIFLSFLG